MSITNMHSGTGEMSITWIQNPTLHKVQDDFNDNSFSHMLNFSTNTEKSGKIVLIVVCNKTYFEVSITEWVLSQ